MFLFLNKNMKIFLLSFLLVHFSVAAQSISEEEKVKEPIQALFNGIRTSDSVLIRSAFATDAILQTVSKKLDGTVSVRTEEVAKFITAVSKLHPEIYDEQITFDLI